MAECQHVAGRSRGIIVAADVGTMEELRQLVEATEGVPQAVAIKVGFALALRFGLRATVDAIKAVCTLPVIYDHQKAATDIPAMGRPFAEVCRQAGVKGVILFPHSGPRTLEAFIAGALEHELIPIVGLVMTHPGYLQSDGGYISGSAPDAIREVAVALGVRSFVLPGNKPDIVSRIGANLLEAVGPVEIMMPGIGSQGGSISQAFEAAAGHRPLAIIGSAIYKAPEPHEALQRFASEIGT